MAGLLAIGSVVWASDVEMIRYRTVINVEKGRLVRTDTVLLQINNRNGEDLSQIEIPYSGNRKISNLEARIEDMNGRVIRELKNQDVLKVNAVADYSLYSDDFVASFTLKHNVYPYRIRYSYTIAAHQFLMVADWYPVISIAVPTRMAALTVTYPSGFVMHQFSRNLEKGKADTLKNMITETWTASYDGRMKKESYAPTLLELLPNVKLVPEDFSYGVNGKTTTWQSMGLWQSDLIKGLQHLPEGEVAMVKRLIAGCKTKADIVRVLYHYLQDHTRYVDVSIDIGGMKPYPAAYVVQTKYGDCKALTNYMKALLEVAGVPSFYTLTYRDDDPPLLIREFPSQQFNHALLTVPVEADTIWLETTDNTNPFGYLGISNQNRLALLVDGGRSHLISLPEMDIGSVQETGKTEYLLSLQDVSTADFRHTYRGEGFELFNAVVNQLNPTRQNEYFRKNPPVPGAELKEWKMVRKDRDSRNIRLEALCSIQGLVKPLARSTYFFTVQPLPLPSLKSPKERQHEIRLAFPQYSVDTLIYHLPGGFSRPELPSEARIESRFGQYACTYTHADNRVILIRSFVLYAGNYRKDEYTDFFNFLNAVKNENKRNIQFQ